MTALCPVAWGTHTCRFQLDEPHLIGVDCECECIEDDPDEAAHAGYPYSGPDISFTAQTPEPWGPIADLNFQHAQRFGLG